MKLTKKQLETLPELYSQEAKENPIAYIHFFNILGRGDWYALEGSKDPDGEYLFFGYVKSPLGEDCDEYGYFTLNQLKEANKSLGISAIELDKHFDPTPINEVIA